MGIGYREATQDDIPLLARMNRVLIRYEDSENPMDTARLIERMEGFLAGAYTAVLLLGDNDITGYCLYRSELPESGSRRVYVRQFYILPGFRRQGLGGRAFRQLLDTVFTDADEITLDVLDGNSAGRAFWESLGFAPYCHRLRLKRDM